MAAETEPGTPTPLSARRGQLRALWRPLGWGVAAALAVAAAVFAGRTDTGSERLSLALTQARENQEPQAVASLPARVVVDAEEARRLADAVRKLAADRDRLNNRIAMLERNLDDMTGSIKTVMQANAAMQSVKEEPAKKPAPLAPITVPSPAASAPPPPKPAAVASAPPAPEPAPAVIAKPSPPPPGAEPIQAGNVPLPPVAPIRIANAEAAADQPPAKIEYGIDLGGALTVEALRGEWVQVKANFGPLLTGLRALASPRQRQNGVDYRLVVGPLPTRADAARLCGKFNAARALCHPAKFAGEDLAQR